MSPPLVVCRLCVREYPNMINIHNFPSNYRPLKTMIYQLFSFWVEPSDFSTSACFQCITLVKQFHNFYILVKDAQDTLLETNKDTNLVYTSSKSGEQNNLIDEKENLLVTYPIKVEEDFPFAPSASPVGIGSTQFLRNEELPSTDTKKILKITDVIDALENNILNSSSVCKTDQDSEIYDSAKLDNNYISFSQNLHKMSKHRINPKKLRVQNNNELCSKISQSYDIKFEESTCNSHDDFNTLYNIDEDSIFPKTLIKNGKFIIKRELLESYASKFFNVHCKICLNLEKFKKLSDMLKHVSLEHGEKGYVTCCNTRLYRRDIIYMHMARHIQPSAFECSICSKKFTRLSALKPHLETHLPEDERSYKCDQCGKSYSNNSGLSYHKLTHLPIEQRTTYNCEICRKSFSSPSSYSTHITVVHSSPKYLCSECGRSFHLRQSYVEHLQIHDPSGKNKVKCQECGFICKNKVTFKFHLKTHSEERFKCNMCEYSTHRKPFLKQHMQVKHSDSKPHACLICAKQFKLKTVLKNHMTQHTGERKFSCVYCPKTFASSANYHTHRRRMHAHQHQTDKNSKQTEYFDDVQQQNMKINKSVTEKLARQEIKQLNQKNQ